MSADGDDGPALPGEVKGWYMYDFANSPHYQVFASSLVPVMLKWLAEEAAYSKYVEQTPVIDPNVDKEQLEIPLFGLRAGSYPLAISVATCFVQIVTILSFSAYGDFGGMRKRLLFAITCAGSGVIMCTIFCVSSKLWWLLGLIRIVSGACFAMCLVYYNSYLPLLSDARPELAGLCGEERRDKQMTLGDEMSGMGMIIGYAGGSALCAICFLILFIFECTDDIGAGCSEFEKFFWPGLCGALIGIWWVGFSQITFSRLKKRPGPPLPEGASMLTFGWRQEIETICSFAKYRQTLLFTISYFIYSDAYNTIITIAPLILSSEFEAAMSETLMYAFVVPLIAILGIYVDEKLQKRVGASAKTMILCQLGVYFVIALMGALGVISALGTPGLYMVFGPTMFILGSIQAYSRALFADLTPKGNESAMFAFFEITDKGSNFIGMAFGAVIHNATGDYEMIFWYVVPALLVAGAVLYAVDVPQGLADAGKTGLPSPHGETSPRGSTSPPSQMTARASASLTKEAEEPGSGTAPTTLGASATQREDGKASNELDGINILHMKAGE